MIVPEPCGYVVLLLITNIQKTVPYEKLHTPVGVPPSGLLTSLRLLVRCLPPATTRRMGGEGERREKREGRKWGIQAQLNHLGCLLVGGVTAGSSLSSIRSITLYPPTRCL